MVWVKVVILKFGLKFRSGFNFRFSINILTFKIWSRIWIMVRVKVSIINFGFRFGLWFRI